MSASGRIFGSLGENEEKKILGLAAKKSYKKGEIIVTEGTPGEKLYIVETGRVLISKKIEGDKDKTLAVLEKGDFFGEMSLLDGGPHSANASAAEDSEMLAIDHRAFEGMLEEDYKTASGLLFFLIRIMSERLRTSTEELVALYETGRLIGSSSGAEDLLRSSLRSLASITSSSHAAFVILNKFSNDFSLSGSIGIAGVERELVDRIANEPSGMISRNLKDEGFEGKISCDTGMLSFMASALRSGEKTLGIVILGKKAAGGFSNKNLTMLSAVASQVATALENFSFLEENAAKKKHSQVYIKF